MKNPLTPAFLDFFQGLAQNNTKEWFDANRKTYEKEVKKPYEVLVDYLISELSKTDADITMTAKQSIFRINRDIRFSNDKTPYKTHMASGITAAGRKSEMPGHYLAIGASGAQVGGGAYWMEKERLELVRSELAAEPEEIATIINDPAFVKTFGSVKGERNKVLPAQFKEAAQEVDLIYHKNFYYMTESSLDLALDPDLPARVLEMWSAGRPLNAFLRRAMGF